MKRSFTRKRAKTTEKRTDKDGIRFINPVLFIIHCYHALDRLPFFDDGVRRE
ncbi:MAG: hypothetical protein Q4E24_06255 [bacterium]|nr:hypothetical protein [bacterium]